MPNSIFSSLCSRKMRPMPPHNTSEDDDGYEGGCQNCGRLIDKSAKGYDDIVSAPYATESGDLYCIPCGREVDRAQRETDEADGFGDYDPYEAAGESPFSLPGGGKSP